MKPFKARFTQFIFKIVNFAPVFFSKGLVGWAEYYSENNAAHLNERRKNEISIANGSFLEGDFIWKAVGVVIRIDHRELDLIHKWIKNKAHPSDYSSERDAKSFSTNFDGLAFHRSLGWIQLSRDRGIHRPLVKIELPETVCDLCYITFDKLPNGITYLSLYFLLSEEATKRIRFANVQEIERYVCFQSFNPFSKNPRILETHNRLQGIENLIKNNLNLTFRDAQLATSYILNMWGIKKKVEEFNTIADFYREYETPYFDKSSKKNNSEDVDDLELTHCVVYKNQYWYDSEISEDRNESYCYFNKKDGIQFDAFYINSQSKKSALDDHNHFSKIGLTISESHLFFTLFSDCFKQYKTIANYANVALLQNNNKPEDNYNILFNSLLKLNYLEENILAIKKYMSFGCLKKYHERSQKIIDYQLNLVNELNSSILKRKENSNEELQIQNIKFHRRYSIIVGFLVLLQITLVALTIDWDKVSNFIIGFL